MFKKIVSYNELDIDKFIEFNKRAFPQKIEIEKLFHWQYICNPLADHGKNIHVLLYLDDQENIVGQFLLSEFELMSNGKKMVGFWGMDYYVQENYRGPYGAILARNALRKHRPYFTIGPSEAAKQISLTLGAKVIGTMKIYMWFRNPINIIRYKYDKRNGHQRQSEDIFPASVDAADCTYTLTEHMQDYQEYSWSNIVQPLRSEEYMRWRFINDFKKYYYYRLQKSDVTSYFVVRKCNLKRFTFLALVDYLVPMGQSGIWNSILKASKIISKDTGCDGVITMSSHRFFDKEMIKNRFFHYGGYKEIVSNMDLDSINGRISERECIYVTMADCDVDLCLDM